MESLLRFAAVPGVRAFVGAALFVGLTLLVLPAGAVSPQSSPQQPTFRSRTEYVEVDAHVTDRQGAFVRGLRKEDFELLEDGKRQEVTALRLVDLPRAADATGTVTEWAKAGRSVALRGASASSDGAVYFIVLDDLHVGPTHSPFGRAIATGFVRESLGPTDVAAVYFTSGRRSVAQDLTTDRKPLVEAIDSLVGARLPPRSLSGGEVVPSPTVMHKVPDTWGNARLTNARTLLDVMTGIAQSAASIRGRRKAVVLVTEGFDYDLNDTQDSANREMRDRMRDLITAANRANLSIYPIDPQGAIQRGDEGADIKSGTAVSIAQLQDEMKIAQDGLRVVAEGTGGTAFVNANYTRAFNTIRDDNSTYYLLAYSPESSIADGKFHEIKVTVSRPGVTVRARKGYVRPAQAAVPASGNRAPAAPEDMASAAKPAAVEEPKPAAAPPAAPVAAQVAPASPAASPAAAPLPSAPSPSPAPVQPAANVDQIVQRATAYVVEYGRQLSLVIGVEKYAQWTTMGTSQRPRQTVSEFALVRVKDDWLGFRDVYEVDAKKVQDRQDRLQKLFIETPNTAVEQGRRIADESARYNFGPFQRNFNVPTTALFFLQPAYVGRFKFKKDGEDAIDGTRAWKVRYEETRKPSIIRTASGKDMPASGTFWVDPVNGRVLKTHMEISTRAMLTGSQGQKTTTSHQTVIGSDGKPTIVTTTNTTNAGLSDREVVSSASVTVSYKTDGRLGLLVPSEMLETYEGPWASNFTEGTTRINCRATYSDFKRFETTARIR